MKDSPEVCMYNYALGLMEGWIEYAAQNGPGSIEIQEINDKTWIVRRRDKVNDRGKEGSSKNYG